MNRSIRLRLLPKLIVLLLVVAGMENCAIIFPVIAPFADLPRPNGPYAVATRTATWIDSSRDETFTPAPDYRRIVVQVWYPVEKGSEQIPNLYIDDPGLRLPAIAKQLRLPVSMIKHIDGVRTHSYTEISTDASGSKFPVILFSHGLSGMRFQNTALMEELASQGYVVFAADHSYAANITIFDNGDRAEYRAGKRRPLTADMLKRVDLSQLSIVVDDLEFMLERIRDIKPDLFLKNIPYDQNTIGVVGHSLGGAAILNAMAIDAHIQAAMVLDGWYIPLPDSILLNGLDKPIFHLGQIQWSDPNNYQQMEILLSNCSGPLYKVLVPGTSHTDFTDMPLFTSFSLLIGYTKIQDPLWLNELTRASTVKFFDVYLKGQASSELIQWMNSAKKTSCYVFIPNESSSILNPGGKSDQVIQP